MMLKFLILILCSILVVNNLEAQSARLSEVATDATNLHAERKFPEARTAYLEFAARDETSTRAIEARFAAAKCLFQMKQYDSFSSEAVKLIAENPRINQNIVRQTQLMLAKAPYQQGKWQEAADKFGAFAAAKMDSNHAAGALAFQGDALRRLHRYEEARQVFFRTESALHTREQLQEAKHRAAQCLYEAGDYEEFMKESGVLLKEDLPATNHWLLMTQFHLAQLPAKLGRPLESAEKLEEFMVANPTFRYTHLAAKSAQTAYAEASKQLQDAGRQTQAQQLDGKRQTVLSAYRTKLETMVVDQASSPAAALSLCNKLFVPYQRLGDYAGMVETAERVIPKLPPHSKQWAIAMVWMGVGKALRTPPDYAGTVATMDAVLALNLEDTHENHLMPSRAATWRAWAQQMQQGTSAGSPPATLAAGIDAATTETETSKVTNEANP